MTVLASTFIFVIALVAVVLVAMFIFGPRLIDSLIDAYDDWIDVLREIRDRRRE